MTGKSKFILALPGIAFLLLNPAGVCAGTPPVHAPSHPCCPTPSSQHHGSGTGACVCIDRQPAAPALPPDTNPFAPVAATETLAPARAFGDEIVPGPGSGGFTLQARFLTFHQLLV